MNERWIPVTERLPGKSGTFLATARWRVGKGKFISVFTLFYNHSDSTWSQTPCFYLLGEPFKVTAWAQLPKPYKESENENAD